VVSYVVDFEKRLVIYYGISGKSYSENYPAVEIRIAMTNRSLG
jgi:uncharacterized protein YbcV (DUF1398 family)